MVDLMKRIFWAAVTLCAVCSCTNKENTFPDGEPQDRTPLTAVKVQVPGDFRFPAGSVIEGWKIVNGGRKYEFSSAFGGNPAEFCLPAGEAGVSQIAYLLYPESVVDSLWRGEFFLSLPQTQTAVENGFDSRLWISAGHRIDGVTELTPVVGALKFKVRQGDVSACEISSADGNGVSGPLMIAMQKDIVVSKTSKSAGSVKVLGNLESGKTYNAVVMADEYSTLDVRLLNAEGATVWEKTLDIFSELGKGAVLDLGEFGNPDISSIRLSMSSTEYAGYTLKGVAVYSDSGTRLFGGSYNEPVVSGQPLSVKISGVEPADYSTEDLWYELTLEDASGTGIILPLKEHGFLVGKGTEVNVDLGVLAENRNSASWFYPFVDRRMMSGNAYAYGEANTFLIQCKTSCYTGTVIDNPDIPGSVTIDYRLRGRLFGGPRPENVEFAWLEGYNNSTPAWGRYTMDRTNIFNCDKYSFTVDSENYKVTVTNNGAHAGSPILLMKKDGKVIWAWTFWNIAADGTRLEAVDFGGVKIANMDIGHCSNMISSIIPKIKYIRQSCNYYQWGRPMPVFSASGAGISLGMDNPNNASKPRVSVYDSGATTLADAIAHPGAMIQNPYTKGKAGSELVDWLNGGVACNSDLWGGTEKDKTGVKSIYDPCPKGWRVPDAKTYFNAVPSAVRGYSTDTYPAETYEGYQGVYVNGVLFVTNGVLTAQTDKDGYVWQVAFTPKADATTKDASIFWTGNCCGGDNSCQCYAFKADYPYKKLNGTGTPDSAERMVGVDCVNSSKALPVRCQKDEDNR